MLKKKKKKIPEFIDLDVQMGIFYFQNVKKENEKFPDTFKIIENNDVQLIEVTDSVKLKFNNEPLWVDITEIVGDTFKGMVNSHLLVNKQIKMHMEVNFKFEHILDVFKKELNKFPEGLKEIQEIGNSIRTNIGRLSGNFNNPYFLTTYKRHKNNENNNS